MSKEKEPTIAEIVYELPRLRVYDDELTSFEEHTYKSTIPVEDKQTYLGIEVEIENIQRWASDYSPYWRMIEDGSLRNNGREFITPPIRAYRVENALNCLFTQQLNPDIDFSERTSIHVHMNIRTLNLSQLRSLVLAYILLEKTLFTWVGPSRKDNIFCVPITDTMFGARLKKLINLKVLQISWSKYTALNLQPIYEKGTIEFRHMYGTKDIPTIIQWINFILCLKKFALRNDPEQVLLTIANLNTNSQYKQFFDSVFGLQGVNLWTDKTTKEIAESVSYVKEMCLSNEFETLTFFTGCDPNSKLMNKKKANVSINQEIGTDADEPQEVELPPLRLGITNRGGGGGRQGRVNPITPENWGTSLFSQDIGTATSTPVATEDPITEERFLETVNRITQMRNLETERSTLLSNMLARLDNNTGRIE